MLSIEWKPLLPDSWLKEKPLSENLSREEMFVKERRRMPLQGINSYQFDPSAGQILFSYGSGIYLGSVAKETEFHPHPIIPSPPEPAFSHHSSTNAALHHASNIHNISPISTPSHSPTSSLSFSPSPCCFSYTSLSPRLDPKLGGRKHNLIAFIRDRDIWVTTPKGIETQLTFSNDHDLDGSAALSCGVAEFVVQEEFHRFTGYYWAPASNNTSMNDNLERILYIQLSESMVEVVKIPRPGPQAEFEEYRYPRAGTPNAVSDLQLVEFIPIYDEKEEGSSYGPVHKRLWGPAAIDKLFPWMEYIVRFGWCPNGKSVWVQLLDRSQQRTAIVKIALGNFMDFSEYQNTCGEKDEVLLSGVELIFEERNHVWINVTDIYYFFDEDQENFPTHTISQFSSSSSWSTSYASQTSTRTKLLITSERTGFRHLYLMVKPSLHSPSYSLRQITAGNWPVIDRPIYVDAQRELVYFIAKKDTPLEAHLYVASFGELANPEDVMRLTELGYSHVVVMDEQCERFLDWFSSLSEKPSCIVRYLEWSEGNTFPTVSQRLCVSIRGGKEAEDEDRRPEPQLPVGELFQFINNDGVTIHGCIYRPDDYIPTKKYPTLLSVYGGPKSQMVTNDYKYPRFLRLFLATRLGFSVVLIDGRGSSDRGLAFESFIKKRMGTVELEDQIAGLNYLAENNMGVDLERVAITGWSYGGYLSLMALAQYPHVFKLAIAGAPVTQWELYDTAYTERYMGVPSENVEGYQVGNVLHWVERFPDSENRLLIAHGQIDENVHHKNTELLVSALVKCNKPHVLQSYPTERHGLRHASVAEHFETLMFFWLVNYL